MIARAISGWAPGLQGVTRFNPKTLSYQHFNPDATDNTGNKRGQFEGDSVWSMLEAKTAIFISAP